MRNNEFRVCVFPLKLGYKCGILNQYTTCMKSIKIVYKCFFLLKLLVVLVIAVLTKYYVLV